MKNNDFEYSYYAPTIKERQEIENIKNQYITKSKTSNKLLELRKLDNMVKNIPMAIAISLGVIGTLIFGLGMSMVLVWNKIGGGIIVGFLGCIPIIFAYPSYKFIFNRLKVKYGSKIINLSNELLNIEEKKI